MTIIIKSKLSFNFYGDDFAWVGHILAINMSPYTYSAHYNIS